MGITKYLFAFLVSQIGLMSTLVKYLKLATPQEVSCTG